MPSNASAALQALNYYGQNRYPLKAKPYMALPLGSVVPTGWLGEQLKLMRNGLAGHLDTIYPEVLGERNGWLGGDGDVWERGPYWLDGLVPLAYILKDEELLRKIQPWIEWTLNSQSEDGYFGPRSADDSPSPEDGLQRDKAGDWWPRMVMLKVLQQYYEASNDQRVIALMEKYFRYQLNELPRTPLNHWSWWGQQRGGDNLAVVYWLYNITREQFLLDLAELIHQQTFNWTETFLKSDKVSELYSFHGVNIAQGLKAPVIYYQQHPDIKYIEAVKKALQDLELFHGQPQGVFAADELIHGRNPTQGSELCLAVELMFSLESMVAITGEVSFMDRLEKIAFNALPAQSTDDYTGRQYYQQANQVMVSRTERNFITAHGHTDLCFGVLSGYPCCTVNMHQGWPKLVGSLWQATDDNGLAALVYAASEVTAKVAEGVTVQFFEETNYPFEETIRFRFKAAQPVFFPFHLRIPAWCTQATIQINGIKWKEAGGNQVIKIERLWTDGDIITLALPMHVSTKSWQEGAISVERGPLVYALRIGENWKEIDNDDKHGSFHEVHPSTDWNFGLLEKAIEQLKDNPKITRNAVDGKYPWNLENAPLEMQIKGKKIDSWKIYNGSAGPLPFSPQTKLDAVPEENLTLIPFGCTRLRITEFPVVQ